MYTINSKILNLRRLNLLVEFYIYLKTKIKKWIIESHAEEQSVKHLMREIINVTAVRLIYHILRYICICKSNIEMKKLKPRFKIKML